MIFDALQYSYSFLRPYYERTNVHRSVIEELPDPKLRDAYAVCRRITRSHAKTFYLATRFLPNEKQRAIFSVYALCRCLDDTVDEAEDLLAKKQISVNDIKAMVDDWKNKLNRTYHFGVGENQVLVALADTLTRFKMPIEPALELAEGVCMDLTKNRYANFAELYDYSYKVASTVGLMTSEIFGYESKEALPYAVDLGIAMQLTNILRDIGEDLDRDRIYLPQDELEKFGISEEDLFARKMTYEFARFMEFQIKRARSYYQRAEKGIAMLNKDSQLPVWLARFNYARILDKIEENSFQVFDQRAYLSTSQKLAILPKALWRIQRAA